MSIKMISTSNAPKAIGPYSQAVRSGDTVYISGQLPIDPATGEMAPDDFASETTRSMENIKAILESMGLSLNNVVRTTIFVADMKKFGDVNAAYSKFFTDYFPARACVEVSCLPKNALVEIDAVATF